MELQINLRRVEPFGFLRVLLVWIFYYFAVISFIVRVAIFILITTIYYNTVFITTLVYLM